MRTDTDQINDKIKKILPIIMATSIFMQMLDSTILNTALPSIAESLNESPLHMLNAILSSVLTFALCMAATGFLADKFGARKACILPLVLFSLGSVFCALTQDLTHLVLSRVIQGLGG